MCLAAEHRHGDMVRSPGLEFSYLTRPFRTPSDSPGRLLAALQRYWLVEGFTGILRRKTWLAAMVEPASKRIEDRNSDGNTIAATKATTFGARLANERLGVPPIVFTQTHFCVILLGAGGPRNGPCRGHPARWEPHHRQHQSRRHRQALRGGESPPDVE